MPVTFHTPPTWPTPPEGFLPGADWEPDPAWGPAPASWTFYTDNGVEVPVPPGAWRPTTATSADDEEPVPDTQEDSAAPSENRDQPDSGADAVPARADEEVGSPVSAAPQRLAPEDSSPEAPPPPRKRRVGLFVAVGVGVVAIIAAAALVVALVFFNKPGPSGPELTADQFSSLFPEGEAIADHPIGYRTDEEPAAATSTHECNIALTSVLREGSSTLSAVTDDQTVYVIAARFPDRGVATAKYESVDKVCDQTGGGAVNGARWLALEFSDSNGALVTYGNTVVFGAANPDSDVSMSDLAEEIQAEVDAAAQS